MEHVAPDPSQPVQRTLNLRGLLGNSDREGYQRIYFSTDLDYFAEFKTEDIVHTEAITPDQPPFVGLDATSVSIKRDASIQYSRISPEGEAPDEFDMDIRVGPEVAEAAAGTVFTRLTPRLRTLGPITPPGGLRPLTWNTTPPCYTGAGSCVACHTGPQWPTCGGTCRDNTCGTCQTCDTQCHQGTCQTCQTQCQQGTCQTCQTCQTQCEATCVTCVQHTCPARCIPVPTQGICLTRGDCF
ncbi:hypothetical protein [Streptomyces chartreusis]